MSDRFFVMSGFQSMQAGSGDGGRLETCDGEEGAIDRLGFAQLSWNDDRGGRGGEREWNGKQEEHERWIE